MLFDQQTITCDPVVLDFPDYAFAGGPRPWNIVGVDTIQASSTTGISITGSAGQLNQNDIEMYPPNFNP